MTANELKIVTGNELKIKDAAGTVVEAWDARNGGHAKELKQFYASADVSTVTLEAAKDALAAVRTRAEGWRTGAATSLALIFAVLSVKDEGIARFSGWDLFWIIVATVGTVATALLALWKIMRAANGPSWLDAHLGDFERPLDTKRYLVRAGAAANDLKWGLRFWIASVAGFTIVVVLSWYLGEG